MQCVGQGVADVSRYHPIYCSHRITYKPVSRLSNVYKRLAKLCPHHLELMLMYLLNPETFLDRIGLIKVLLTTRQFTNPSKPLPVLYYVRPCSSWVLTPERSVIAKKGCTCLVCSFFQTGPTLPLGFQEDISLPSCPSWMSQLAFQSNKRKFEL